MAELMTDERLAVYRAELAGPHIKQYGPGDIGELLRYIDRLRAENATGYRACECGALVCGVVDGSDATPCLVCGRTEGVCLEAAWAKMRADLDKLPKTADCVPVVPGMVLYSSQFICGRFRGPETVVELVAYADPEQSEWAEGSLDAEKMYSTEAAARKAMNAMNDD